MDNMMIEFMNLVMEGLSKKLTSVSLQTKEIVKLNGIKLHSITITGEQSNLSPCIYLDSYYEDYRSGKVDIAHIVDNIIAVYNRNSLENNLDTSLFTDYSKASKLLYGRLVNTEMNKELLETVPHREFQDLSLIYTVVLNLNNETGNIHITNEHMQRWGVSENDLYCQVKTNMETNKEYTIQSMAEVIQCLAGDDTDTFLPEINKDNCPMYVLTNKKQFNGAVEIINEKVLT